VAPPREGRTPFFDRRQVPLEDVGPGREDPDPQNVSEVRIGFFGPDDPAHAEGGDLWCAAVLAIEDANQHGGYRGKPFRLVARWSDNPWTGGAAHVTRMVYEDGVWAIVGGIDSASTHLAEQVTTKARLPLVCGASTDRTTNSAIVPWMFSVLPGNQLQAPLLAAELSGRIGSMPFVVIAGEDHESRSFLGALKRSLTANQLAPRFQFVYRPSDAGAVHVVRRALQSQPAAVMLVADAHGSAGLAREIRAAGFQGDIFGGPAMGRRRCLDQAGSAGEGIIVPLVVEPSDKWLALEATFQKRFQRRLDFAAAGTYDAVQLLVAAIRKAGLNRARIGDALRALAPWDGAAGPVRWDKLGGNTRPAHLAVVTQDRLARLDPAAGQPELAFRPGSDFATWQQTLRRRLIEILVLPSPPFVPLAATRQRESQTAGYTLDRIQFTSEPGEVVPGYLLVPVRGAPPFPVMICLQGHSPGMHISIGQAANEREKAAIAGGRDIALQAAGQGWAALVIEQRAFGRRAVPGASCQDAALRALLRGRPLTGLRVLDVIRAVDFIATQADLDPQRIATMGNSMGGTVSFYAACVEPRIRLAVVSCSFCTFADSWLSRPHCACGYLPGLLRVADMPDLAGLIAPRDLLIVAGKQDALARFEGVEEGYRRARQAFAAAGAEDRVKLRAADGDHRFYPDLAWPEINRVREQWQPAISPRHSSPGR
jgi:ABC-type branched-subunit amino acid transport system substrate-binding protein/dienelactone hydrolase